MKTRGSMSRWRSRSILDRRSDAQRRSLASSIGLALAVSLALGFTPALAVSMYVVPDAPTDLGGTTYLSNDIVRYNTPAYSLQVSLPPGTTIDGLHRMASGDYLFSVEAPVDLGGTTYLPQDIIQTNGAGVYSSFFCGKLVGIPAEVNVDAVILDSAGNLLLSFDIPTTAGLVTIDPSDLVRFMHTGVACNSWSFAGVVFDASATAPPVRAESNVTAADLRPGLTVISFDVPTTLGAATFLPGHVDSWNGAAYALFEPLAGWPASSYVNAISFSPAPGTVPVTITATRLLLNGSQIRLSWAPSCSAGGENYGIYEGAIGSWYSHSLIDCSDDFSDLTEDIGTTSGNRYYLVVPRNGNEEGSYGRDSSGTERPAGAPACLPSQVLSCP